ncbi:MAG: cell envelope integrity protein TolA [Gammaproteobacteria bacterium]|nr:cell envelope integrity protein TolA [Gammaproteobacteria bacterium]
MYSKRAVVLSVVLHGLLIVLLTASVDFLPDKLVKPNQAQPIVQARVIDQGAVTKEIERLKAADEARRREQEKSADALAQKRRAEEQQLKELQAKKERLKREEEAASKARAEAERKAESARKEAAEAERKAAAAKKKAAAEAKAKAETAAAKKAAEEAEKQAAAAAKKQAEEAARKKAEAEAKAKAEAERKRLEQALQDELAAEEAAAQAAADASEINRYVAAIANRVRQSFTILPGLEGLSCTLRITLVPGGEVAGVQIVKSSGNPTFDRQAENAVRKAAPLPVPSDPRLFQQMRSIAFVFDPQS